MAVPFKSYSFDKVVKKYTLCGLCDGKLSESPFFICGCDEVLCSYCNEKHSCGFQYKAVKYDTYKSCKSISFIHDLVKLVPNGQHEKEKDREISQQLGSSCSTTSCLPELDDVKVNKTSDEVLFSQLFDEVSCFRNTKPKAVYSGAKRDSISPRISYSLKRHLYLSDTEDEDDCCDERTPKTTPKCSSNMKKRLTKKRKCSTKKARSSLGSSVCYDSDFSQQQGKEAALSSRRIPLSRISCSQVNTDANTLVSTEKVLQNGNGECSVLENNNLHLKDVTSVIRGSLNDHNCSNKPDQKSSVNEVNINIENSNSPLENELIPKNHENNSNHIHKGIQQLIGPEDQLSISSNSVLINDTDETESYCNDIMKRYKVENSEKKSTPKFQQKKAKREKLKNNENFLFSKQRDFDGFDSCEINASTLNYLFYTLTTSNRCDSIFPMNYKGKKFFIHTGKNIETPIDNNEYHYLLTRIGDVKTTFTQTSRSNKDIDDNRVDQASKIIQTEKCKVKNACIGCDDSHDKEVQTDPYLFSERSVGPESRVAGFTQTDDNQVLDASVGPDGRISNVVQTDGYLVLDAFVSPEARVPGVVQTDSYQVSDASVGPDNGISKMIQTEGYLLVNASVGPDCQVPKYVQTSECPVPDSCSNSGMPPPSARCTSNKNESHPSNVLKTAGDGPQSVSLVNNGFSSNQLPTENNESFVSEEEEIIEGTPEKTNNLSFSSLDLSILKERTPHFNLKNKFIMNVRKDVISCTGLTYEEKQLVREFAKHYQMEYCDECTIDTTYVVISSRFVNETHKTFKYIMAIALKTCIVSLMWVTDSLNAGNVLPAEKYIPTNFAGPSRCRMNLQPPLSGVSICSQMVTCYPGVKSMEGLCKLCAAVVVSDIGSSAGNCPLPRFFLFESESQLTPQLLNNCSRYLFLPINYTWVFDSVVAYKRQPILQHLSSAFVLTKDIIGAFKIPRDLIDDVF